MNDTKINNIPVYLEASSKRELIEKMLKNNMLNGKVYNYQTPVKEGRNWVVWFFADVFNDKHVDNLSLPKDPVGEIK